MCDARQRRRVRRLSRIIECTRQVPGHDLSSHERCSKTHLSKSPYMAQERRLCYMNLVMIDNLVAQLPSAVRPPRKFFGVSSKEPLGPSPKSVLKEHEFTRDANARFSVCASRLVPSALNETSWLSSSASKCRELTRPKARRRLQPSNQSTEPGPAATRERNAFLGVQFAAITG